jgi:hypothetical protein
MTEQDIAQRTCLNAAAPDMLEALQRLLTDDGGRQLLESGAISVNQLRLARNAIEKATGFVARPAGPMADTFQNRRRAPDAAAPMVPSEKKIIPFGGPGGEQC